MPPYLPGACMMENWVVPFSMNPYAALLYVHPAPGNKDSFLDEAVRLAKHGTASLLIDAPWSQEAWAQTLGKPEQDRDIFIVVIKELRRAIDLVASQPNIDVKCIGYVGHSFGALCGGVLAGTSSFAISVWRTRCLPTRKHVGVGGSR